MDNGYKETLAIMSSMWKHKLITIAGINLSLGNVLVALFLLLFAARLSRMISRLLYNRLIQRFVEDKGSQVTYQTFSYYGSLALVVCLSLTIAGIPLTVFTVVGGALAIGVGFGSQNIVNNFISGVILLIEQPMRVGDTVQLDGITGVVVSINTRSTKIRNGENKIFIVPNSFFLEKSVLNSTYETTILRGTIDFGVAYGSDTSLVENLCMDIMLNTEGIVQDPLPSVQFTNFGDSNLTFQMIFYCNVDLVASISAVSSAVRFKLDNKFRQMGVEMAFPQREMHLKVKDSLNVRVLS